MSFQIPCVVAAVWLSAAAASHAQGPRQLQADHAASHIYAITQRSGLFGFLGHDHVIAATVWSADLCIDETTPSASRATLVVQTRHLVIDSDDGRRRAGLGGGPTGKRRDDIQRKLLDDRHLAAEKFPELRFTSTSATRTADTELTLKGQLTVKGVVRDVELPVTIAHDGAGRWSLTGTLRIRQTDFGLKPESIAAVVKVADHVDIHVQLLASETGRACSER